MIQKKPGLDSKEQARQRVSGRRTFSAVFNLASMPALSGPCGFITEDGVDLPTGLQLSGRPFAYGPLLKVAHAYDQSTP